MRQLDFVFLSWIKHENPVEILLQDSDFINQVEDVFPIYDVSTQIQDNLTDQG